MPSLTALTAALALFLFSPPRAWAGHCKPSSPPWVGQSPEGQMTLCPGPNGTFKVDGGLEVQELQVKGQGLFQMLQDFADRLNSSEHERTLLQQELNDIQERQTDMINNLTNMMKLLRRQQPLDNEMLVSQPGNFIFTVPEGVDALRLEASALFSLAFARMSTLRFSAQFTNSLLCTIVCFEHR